jgi:hypothetical protein
MRWLLRLGVAKGYATEVSPAGQPAFLGFHEHESTRSNHEEQEGHEAILWESISNRDFR